MSEPFIGEVRMFGFGFAPRGWALCDGQILPIAQSPSLYSILGARYGGDGVTTFALPDLRGRTPVHVKKTGEQGVRGGEEKHSLSEAEIPAHSHKFVATGLAGTEPTPRDNLLAQISDAGSRVYNTAFPTDVDLNPAAISSTGTGAGHENMQPFQTINYCIALLGRFPSRS